MTDQPTRKLAPCCLSCHHWDMAQSGDFTEESGGYCHGRAPGETDDHGAARWPVTFAYQTCGGWRTASNGELQRRAQPQEEMEEA